MLLDCELDPVSGVVALNVDRPAFQLRAALPAMPANGGSCIAGPDGTFLVEPVVGEERLITAELDHAFVRRERQNFDPAGHYARPDVLRLEIDRARQVTLRERSID
jgi:nitrilase